MLAAQKAMSLVRPVAAEAFAPSHRSARAVQSCDDRWRESLSRIADAAADQALGRRRIGFAKARHTPRNLREKVARFEFEIVMVEVSHGEVFYLGRKPGGKFEAVALVSAAAVSGCGVVAATGSGSPNRSRAFL